MSLAAELKALGSANSFRGRMQEEHVVVVKACAICGKEARERDDVVTFTTYFRDSRVRWTRAHADCLRPLLPEHAKWFLDPEKTPWEGENDQSSSATPA